MGLGSHPLNLALRFGLEIAVLIGAGVFGWQISAWIFAVLVFLHVGLSIDRLRWLWHSAGG